MVLFTPLYAESPPLFTFNYGNFDVFLNSTKASVKDMAGHEIISKNLTDDNLAFNASNLKHSRMCFAKASKQTVWTLIRHWLHYLIDIKENWLFVGVLFLPFFCSFFGLAIIIAIIRFIH